MCLGIPGKIVAITDTDTLSGIVEISGIRREVNLSCVIEGEPANLLGCWVLIHVGFAMCIIDEAQARKSLEAMNTLQQLLEEADQNGIC